MLSKIVIVKKNSDLFGITGAIHICSIALCPYGGFLVKAYLYNVDSVVICITNVYAEKCNISHIDDDRHIFLCLCML